MICILITQYFKPGDSIPPGYLDRQEWARVQLAAGLRQKRRDCGYFHFPQEICEHLKENQRERAPGRKVRGPKDRKEDRSR